MVGKGRHEPGTAAVADHHVVVEAATVKAIPSEGGVQPPLTVKREDGVSTDADQDSRRLERNQNRLPLWEQQAIPEH